MAPRKPCSIASSAALVSVAHSCLHSHMHRPLVSIALLYAAGILLGAYFPVPLPALLAATIAILVLTIITNRVSASFAHLTAVTRVSHLTLLSLILLTGWLAMLVNTSVLSPNDLRTLVGVEPHLVT